MRLIRLIAATDTIDEPLGIPQERFSRGGRYTGSPLFRPRATVTTAIRRLKLSATSKPMWTLPPLWTHRTRPQGFGNLAKNARFPQRPHRSSLALKKRMNQEQNRYRSTVHRIGSPPVAGAGAFFQRGRGDGDAVEFVSLLLKIVECAIFHTRFEWFRNGMAMLKIMGRRPRVRPSLSWTVSWHLNVRMRLDTSARRTPQLINPFSRPSAVADAEAPGAPRG